MATTYRGIYRSGSGGKPSYVQVISPGGHSLPLPIEDYESRGVLPDWRELPTENQYEVLVAVLHATRGRSTLIKSADAEACVDGGWLEPVGISGWQLTEAGNRLL